MPRDARRPWRHGRSHNRTGRARWVVQRWPARRKATNQFGCKSCFVLHVVSSVARQRIGSGARERYIAIVLKRQGHQHGLLSAVWSSIRAARDRSPIASPALSPFEPETRSPYFTLGETNTLGSRFVWFLTSVRFFCVFTPRDQKISRDAIFHAFISKLRVLNDTLADGAKCLS